MDWHNRFVQQSHWTGELRGHLFRRAAIDAAQRILEVGCGTGAIIMDLLPSPSTTGDAGKIPDLQIHGLDINSDFLSQAAHHAPFARLTLGDAHSLPYADSAFDLVFCHFLLLWVSNANQVLNEMARVTRSGGYILALAEPDYGGRIDFPESLVEIGAIQEAALRKQGADTHFGRRLRGLFHQTGLMKTEAGIMGGYWQGNRSTEEIDSEWQVLKDDLNGVFSLDEFDRLKEMEGLSWQSGERILFVPTFFAWGKKE
jgi:SAM-dependent methyltransferase